MLRVVYEAVQDLGPDQAVELREAHGTLRVRIREGTPASDFLPPLNAAFERLLAQCSWFQLWRGHILSADSPEHPLSVRFLEDPAVDLRTCVQIREHCGEVRVHVLPRTPAELFVRAINPAVEQFLAGGQWFQLWQGEIVTMDPPHRDAA